MAEKYLPIETILSILQETPPRLVDLTSGLPKVHLHKAPKQEEWSINEILAHLRACSDVWGERYIMTILNEDGPVIKAMNPRTWIKKTNYLELDFSSSLKVFARQRKKLLAVLASLSLKDWERTNTLIGAGKPLRQTLLSHADGLARHERTHLKQIERTINALEGMV